MGGSGAVGGIAEQVKDGYVVNGFWKYATGAPHLTHFTANCYIQKDGKPILNEDGSKSIRSFSLRKKK
ncbi:hypothetical protein [Niabella ginsengisoli]|uniref:Uncharacterized protein n=1 Tax=Niabella ginsengisoli TaxID=522298 RepID=A0ABS9SMI3_9BACT|nr:hypothetical protein [Niabella ginsengisoli]MCH5599545.1 hypothetical protein [Niabella ginsengisoli]